MFEQQFDLNVHTQQCRGERAAQEPLASTPIPARPPEIDPRQHGDLGTKVADHPAATLAELGEHQAMAGGIQVSVATMSRTHIALGLSRNTRP